MGQVLHGGGHLRKGLLQDLKDLLGRDLEVDVEVALALRGASRNKRGGGYRGEGLWERHFFVCEEVRGRF